MKIHIIALGKPMPKWIAEGFHAYAKQMPAHLPIHLKELRLTKRTKTANLNAIYAKEADQILQAIPPGSHVIGLDVTGKRVNTHDVAKALSTWQIEYSNIVFLIGGPEGFIEKTTSQCHTMWSLSNLTFPHMLVRVILAEQLYRAWTIQQNHPYHRE